MQEVFCFNILNKKRRKKEKKCTSISTGNLIIEKTTRRNSSVWIKSVISPESPFAKQKFIVAFCSVQQPVKCSKVNNGCDKPCASWASYQIRNIAGCACAGNAGNVFPCHRLQRKPLVSGPGMHHGTCVTHVPRCMSGSLASGGGENVPGIPGACAPAILRIW